MREDLFKKMPTFKHEIMRDKPSASIIPTSQELLGTCKLFLLIRAPVCLMHTILWNLMNKGMGIIMKDKDS